MANVYMLATVPLVFALAPGWAYMLKSSKSEDDRLRMVESITSWPSLIALALGVGIMGAATGWKIAGIPGAAVGTLLVAVFEAITVADQRRLHESMKARQRGEGPEPAVRPSIARITIGSLTILGSIALPAAMGYAIGGLVGAAILAIVGALYTGMVFAAGWLGRRKLQRGTDLPAR